MSGIMPELPNAKWMVSVNHIAGSVPFREPPPRIQGNPNCHSRFCAIVFVVNSGYRTRYPQVAAVTSLSAGKRMVRP